jgi:GT2 family glycosyltransferase
VVQKGKKNSMPGKPASSRGKALKGKVSVVIPVEPGGSALACLKALESLPKAEKGLIFEVLLAQGQHPSRQRNLAVAQAKAPWILFLDSDSRLVPGTLTALLDASRQMKAAVVGGPNLPLKDEPFWGRVFQRVIGSWLGSMASRARYKAVGYRRLSNEKELILCNLLVDRKAFLAVGGFNEALYPNEENELFNRMQAQGQKLAYEPDAIVLRPRRHSVAAFAYQAFRYGRGRAQQMRANFFVSDLVNLLPLLLVFFWASLVLCPGWAVRVAIWVVVVLGLTLVPVRSSTSRFEWFFYLPVLALRHHAYAIGLIAGAFQNAAKRPFEVHLKRVPWRP